MKPLDSYRAKSKLFTLGKLIWKTLIIFSKITISLFVLITCIVFWMNMSNILMSGGVDISKRVSQMILIVLIVSGLIIIDFISKFNIKKIKSEEEIIKEEIEKKNKEEEDEGIN